LIISSKIDFWPFFQNSIDFQGRLFVYLADKNGNINKYGGKMSEERTGIVTMGGRPMTLLGPELKKGNTAPEFLVLDNSLKPVKLSDSNGKIRLLSAVPSLDTEVCALETEIFNKEAQKLSKDVVVYTISMDLPFAQKRWVDENEIEDVITLSDFNNADFGKSYGVLLKELRLLTRAVIVVDKNDKIADFQIVPEISNEPDYGRTLEAIRNIS
jgi:thiol peroxidase